LHVENVFGRQRRHRALQPAAIERVIGIGSYMQNKPNFRKAKMNVRAIKTKGYENNRLGGRRENKPNQTQSQVAFRKSRRELSIRPMYASPTEPSTPESRR
ncbi:MAG: hypothetical protein ACYS19_17115, partial [Planctomycetota bacterium]